MPLTAVNDPIVSSNDHIIIQRPATPDERVRWSASLNIPKERGRDTRRPTSSRLRFPSVNSEVSEHPSDLPDQRRRRPTPSDAPSRSMRNAPPTPPRRSGWDYFKGVDLTGEDPQDIENNPVAAPPYVHPPEYNGARKDSFSSLVTLLERDNLECEEIFLVEDAFH